MKLADLWRWRQEWGKRRRLHLIILLLIIMTVLFWPIRYNPLSVTGDAFSEKVTLLKSGQPVTLVVKQEENYFSAVDLWIKAGQSVEGRAPLQLQVYSLGSSDPVRSVNTTFGSVYNKNRGSIRLAFRSLSHSAGNDYSLVLTLADNSDESIQLRQPNESVSGQNQAAFVQTLVTKSLSVVLIKQLLGINTEGQDIYYYWHRGGEVAQGDNPYLCALDRTCIDNKNPGHFPLFYWLSAFSQRLGLIDFSVWIEFWRQIFVGTWLLIGAIIFSLLYSRHQPWLSLFGSFFWLFNRWSLYVLRVGQIDFLAVLFLVLSIVLLNRRRWLALLCLSVSLALKQMAIFLVPLYLIWRWHINPNQRWRNLLLGLAIIASVPTITSLPFIVRSPLAFLAGLSYSVTRTSESDLDAPTLSRITRLRGSQEIVLTILMMTSVYGAYARRKISLSMAALAVMLIFLAFNPTIFNQYFVWAAVLLPLALSEAQLQKAPPLSSA